MNGDITGVRAPVPEPETPPSSEVELPFDEDMDGTATHVSADELQSSILLGSDDERSTFETADVSEDIDHKQDVTVDVSGRDKAAQAKTWGTVDEEVGCV